MEAFDAMVLTDLHLFAMGTGTMIIFSNLSSDPNDVFTLMAANSSWSAQISGAGTAFDGNYEMSGGSGTRDSSFQLFDSSGNLVDSISFGSGSAPTVTAVISGNSALLSWDNVDPNQNFDLWQSYGSYNQEIANVSGLNSFLLSNLNNDAQYFFLTAASTGSDSSGVALAAAPDAAVTPSAQAVSSNAVDISFSPYGTPGETYNIYRGDAIAANRVATNISGGTFRDIHAPAGSSVTYNVTRTTDTAIGRQESQPVAANTVATPTAPTVTMSQDGTAAALTWTPPVDATGMSMSTGTTIRRSADGGAHWQTIATLPAGTTNFTDTTLAGNTSYTYAVTDTIDGNGNGSAATTAANATLGGATPDTGVLAAGRAFFGGVTDQNTDGSNNATNSDGGLTYSGPVDTEALTSQDAPYYPNFQPTKFAGLFNNGGHADFTLNGADTTTQKLMRIDFTFLEVIDSQAAAQTIMTPTQVAQDLTINGNPVDSAAYGGLHINRVNPAPSDGLLIPDSHAGDNYGCIAYKRVAAFSVSDDFISTDNVAHIAFSGLPAGQMGAILRVAANATPSNICVVHYWSSDAANGNPSGHVSMTLPDGTYISWWPVNHTPFSSPADKARTLAKDTAGEGGRAPVDIRIEVSDMAALLQWWNQFSATNDTWRGLGPNCTTVVEDALNAGGVYGIPANDLNVFTPDNLFPYLQEVSAIDP